MRTVLLVALLGLSTIASADTAKSKAPAAPTKKPDAPKPDPTKNQPDKPADPPKDPPKDDAAKAGKKQTLGGQELDKTKPKQTK